ncbi:ribonuclease P protein subunit [Candidatus Bathyarchaeota archaeon]|nr:ribonuclease P protein subunit [Candidatus Bathyarchaeota archaeon]
MQANNILFHELIGLEVKVTDSPAITVIGTKGVVIDETMNTLVIQKPDGKRNTILKDHNEFTFTVPDGTKIPVCGNLLVGRPWDRLKNIGKRQFRLTNR